MTVVDRDTQKPLPYRYMELFIDPAKTAKGNIRTHGITCGSPLIPKV